MENVKLTILVVDDCSVMRFVVQRTIKMCGFDQAKMIEANNGKEALKILETHTVDLIIADINMPVMGGIEMIEHLKETSATSNIPIITVSTESNQPRVDLITEMSTSFIHKPFSPELLRDKLLKLLEKKAINI
ncbi:MAG: response regulator [Balneolaceae bacterium]|nr:response regulator [Balneolaceae bacterium]